ncbi:MAG: hypothetical protein ACLR23_26760 [Clostridia bacterium]
MIKIAGLLVLGLLLAGSQVKEKRTNEMIGTNKEIAVLRDTEFAMGFTVLAPGYPVRSVGVLRPAEARGAYAS